MKNLVLFSIMALVFAPAVAANSFDHSHSLWTQILQKHVRLDGAISLVNYKAIQDNPAPLNLYLKSLSEVSRAEYDGWTPDRQLAFLINAYNAFTVKLIVDNYPVDSIKDLGGWFSTPWKRRFFTLLGEERTLDEIEHGTIRVDFNEPRIHFAVNCASLGCPPLMREAFVAERLDAQLEESTLIFLRDPRRNRYDSRAGRLELSSIFRWYGGDFEKTHGSVAAFVAARITSDPREQGRIQENKIRIDFLSYDWSLNDWK